MLRNKRKRNHTNVISTKTPQNLRRFLGDNAANFAEKRRWLVDRIEGMENLESIER